MQPGDVYKTCANIDAAEILIGYQPEVGVEDGLKNFVDWYVNRYQ